MLFKLYFYGKQSLDLNLKGLHKYILNHECALNASVVVNSMHNNKRVFVYLLNDNTDKIMFHSCKYI